MINKENVALNAEAKSRIESLRAILVKDFLHQKITEEDAKAHLLDVTNAKSEDDEIQVALNYATTSRHSENGEMLYTIGRRVIGFNEILKTITTRFQNAVRPTFEEVFDEMICNYPGQVNHHIIRQAYEVFKNPKRSSEHSGFTLYMGHASYPNFRVKTTYIGFPKRELATSIIRWDGWRPTIIITKMDDPSEFGYDDPDYTIPYHDFFEGSFIDPTTGYQTDDYVHCVPVLFSIHAYALFKKGGANSMSDLYMDEIRRLALAQAHLKDEPGLNDPISGQESEELDLSAMQLAVIETFKGKWVTLTEAAQESRRLHGSLSFFAAPNEKTLSDWATETKIENDRVYFLIGDKCKSEMDAKNVPN